MLFEAMTQVQPRCERQEERDALIVKRILSDPDLSYTQVGKRFGVSSTTVSQAALKAGLPSRRGKGKGYGTYDFGE